jgi:hypothetical protein
MHNERKTNLVMWTLSATFLLLSIAFILNPWGHAAPRTAPALVDPEVLDPAPVRTAYADWVRMNEDVSEFDCLACHEKDKPPVLTYDEHGQIVIPVEHENIVLGHGTHGRNNNCYNCHNQADLTTLSSREGDEMGFAQSSQLCGSCHGPTIRDWDSGAHGRTNGYWNVAAGDAVKLDCVNCHDPHTPHFPGRAPAPGPHSVLAEPAVAPSSPTPP